MPSGKTREFFCFLGSRLCLPFWRYILSTCQYLSKFSNINIKDYKEAHENLVKYFKWWHINNFKNGGFYWFETFLVISRTSCKSHNFISKSKNLENSTFWNDDTKFSCQHSCTFYSVIMQYLNFMKFA